MPCSVTLTCDHSCPSPGSFTARPAPTRGLMTPAVATTSLKARVGNKGDPLMPALYALAQQPALCEVQAQLRDGEAIFAFLDDTYVVARPDRVRPLYDAFRAMPVLSSTVARPVYGMLLGRSRQESPTCRVTPTL